MRSGNREQPDFHTRIWPALVASAAANGYRLAAARLRICRSSRSWLSRPRSEVDDALA
jgi:hypothetical protein